MKDFSPFTVFQAIRNRSVEAVIGQSGLNHAGLVAELRRRFGSADITAGGLLREPVVEAAPGYVASSDTLGELAGSLLHSDTVAALDGADDSRPDRYRFRSAWYPYEHQVEAWRRLAEPGAANSILVTSGTGSGKTECFLVPIIDDLVRQSRGGRIAAGVQAIVIYPLNALIASQEERLRDWTAPFEGKLRFALYNGLLPNEVKTEHARGRPETVPDRRSLRASPPPILVTNVTMLEYMLLRPEDLPILQQSQGKLRTVVLDEAHSYIGAQAAEIALLLRRVCLAFGTKPQEVHFVATSATIGRPEADASADAELARFLADVSGAAIDRVSIIRGRPRWPELPAASQTGHLDAAALKAGYESGEAFASLAGNANLRQLLLNLRSSPQPWSALEQAAAAVNLAGSELAASLAAARRNDETLSPLRVHGFQRAIPGLWSCLDRDCPGERPRDWPFGALAGDDAEACAFCAGPTFEILSCRECGEPYLDVIERDDGQLARPTRARPDDDFALEAEAAEDAEAGLEEGEPGAFDVGRRHLLTSRSLSGVRQLHVELPGARSCDGPGPRRHAFTALSHGPSGGCGSCGAKKRKSGPDVIRSFRFGAPFLLGNAVPLLLEGAAAPERQKTADRMPPLGGRQLLSFTDSRQGTARLSAKLQIGAERNFVRSFIYHAVQAELSNTPDTSIVDEKITNFEVLVQKHPEFVSYLTDARAEKTKLLSEAQAGLPWTKMVARLAERNEVKDWLRDLWSPRDAHFESPTALAEFLLLREFSRRPKRANSLETMGLARLRFDAVEAAAAPKDFRDLGGTPEDWRAFLDTLLTHLVRANSAVRLTPENKNWIQPKASLTGYVHKPKGELSRYQRRWPAVPQGRQALGAIARPIRLLGKGFGLDLDDTAIRASINDCMDAAWGALLPLLAQPGAGENRLDLSKARIAAVGDAFLCPVTGRVLDVAFRGLTPYGAERASGGRPAEPIALPRHPAPFPGGLEEDEALVRAVVESWLVDDPAIGLLRARGSWSNLQDRIALFADYFRSAEHSAQQAPHVLRGYEAAFKRGTINVLNCSTTMEMGVDIGSVSHVMMTNLPPSIASYRQRVGRAGRRRQAMSLAFTFCKDRPHDRTAFLNPLEFLSRSMRAPRVALDSAVIVQRHVNALLFTTFVHRQRADAFKMKAGPFFGCPWNAKEKEVENNPATHFSSFAAQESVRAELAGAIADLVRGSALDGDHAVFDAAADAMADARRAFTDQWRALRDLRAGGAIGDGAADKSLSLQIRRLCDEYLLRALGDRGFLPSHGFPTAVVSFLCRTAEKPDEAFGPDGENPRPKIFPQRPLDVAMREYAPGSEVVLDGLVHRSAGITLNWRRPASAEGVREIQSLRWKWRCKACGESGTAATRDDACQGCGATETLWIEYLQPAGFAADLRQDPHADPDEVSFVPAEPPYIGLGGASWVALANPHQGRRRENRNGSVFFCNSGSNRLGYAICLHCGRADPEDMEREIAATWLHKPLLAKPDADGSCPGAHKPFGVKRRLRLGYEISTDVFEFQPTGLASQGAALALAVALRETLALRLGIEPAEIGVAAARHEAALGGRYSVFLFDRASGGAGFSIQAGPMLDELLPDIRKVLDCTVPGCVRACPACVLAGDLSEDEAASLDRRDALAVVEALAAEATPAEADRAAPGARLVPDVLDALVRARSVSAQRLVVRLAGPLDIAALAAWSAMSLVRRWSDSGRDVTISVPLGAIAAMDGAALPALRDRLSAWGAKLEEAPEAELPNGARVLAEVVEAGCTLVLATRDAKTFVGGSSWGRPQSKAVVRFNAAEPCLIGTNVPLDRLQPPPGARVRTIEAELDGSMRSFGKGMAALLRSALDEAGASGQRISKIAYRDRYLNSPLTARLAIDTLAALAAASPGRPVPLLLSIRSLQPRDRLPVRYIHHDWPRDDTRTVVLSHLAIRMGLVLTTKIGDPPHSRAIDLTFEGGRTARIFLDQGFGAWDARPSASFPFHDSDIKQANALAAADARIVRRGMTYAVAQIT